jgi:hypothetical protein
VDETATSFAGAGAVVGGTRPAARDGASVLVLETQRSVTAASPAQDSARHEAAAAAEASSREMRRQVDER